MKSKNILLTLICACVFFTVPVSVAAVGSKKEIERADSAFKTFKKDIRCMLSRRQQCTDEQKRRLIRDGLGLIAVAAAITGLVLGAKYVGIPAYIHRLPVSKKIEKVEAYARKKGLRFSRIESQDDKFRMLAGRNIVVEKVGQLEIRFHTGDLDALRYIKSLFGKPQSECQDSYSPGSLRHYELNYNASSIIINSPIQ